MNLLILLCSFFVGTLVTSQSSSGIKYVLTVSKSVVSGSPTTICLLTQNSDYPLDITLGFNYTDVKDNFEITKEYACFQLNVPPFSGIMPGATYLTITLNKKGDSSPLVSSHSRIITVFDAERPNYQLQMDKLHYRVGDKILIRIFSSNQYTEPVNDEIKDIAILDHDKKETISWKDPKSTVGILHLEYEIKENDPVGIWSININNNEMVKEFQVIPPHVPNDIQVILKFPEFVNLNDRNVTIKVCALYTNQKPVTGEVLFSINLIKNKMTDSDSDIIENKIEFNATITDSVTKSELNESGFISAYPSVYPCDINIELLTPNGRVHPGIPFVGKVKISDRKVDLDGKTFQVCYKVLYLDNADSLDYVFEDSSNPKYCVDIIIGVKEYYVFTIPPFKYNTIKNVAIGARLVDYPKITSELFLRATTGENSIELVPVIPSNLEECNEKLNFIVTYTQNNVKSDITGFNFMITSRSKTDKAEWISTSEAIKQAYNPENHQNPILEKTDFILESAEIFTVPFEVKSTDIKPDEHNVIVYYLPNDEMISDGYGLNILSCLKHKAEVSWEKDTVNTNEKVVLKILTTKNAICSVSATEETPEIVNYIPTLFESPSMKCSETMPNNISSNTNTILQITHLNEKKGQFLNR
nr:murinoglobulin-2-like [Onthophagus taurus]